MRQFACDGIIFRGEKVLLIKRACEPFKGMWAIPGGRIEEGESAEECLKREMREETGFEVEPTALVGIYSAPERDPRGVIVAAYICRVVGGKEQAGDDAAESKWFDVKNLPKLASDHNKIMEDALKQMNTSKN